MRRAPVGFFLWLVACGGTTAPPSASGTAHAAGEDAPLEAVQCRVTAATQGRRFQEGTRTTTNLTMIAGDTRTMQVGAATLETTLFGSAVQVALKQDERELFSAQYGFDEHLPDNQYGADGFTGRVFIAGPDESYLQLTCHSVPRSAYTDSPADHTAQREARADAERGRLYTTLTETEACTLTRAQREAGVLCPPKHPLQARVDALIALRRLRVRRFMDITLEGANLASADLRETCFQNVILTRADLHGAQLYACDLRFAKLEGANMQGANVYATNLRSANLRNAQLQGTSFGSAELEHVDLSGADLSGANLMQADLDGANLTGANLNGTMLMGASLSGANLDGANLENARNLTQQQLDDAHGDPQTRVPSSLVIRRQRVTP